MAIDRQGKIESWRIAAENPIEPYKRFKEGGLKEIMDDIEPSQLNDIQKDSQKLANTSNATLVSQSNEGNKVFWINKCISILVFIPIVFFLIKYLKTKKR